MPKADPITPERIAELRRLHEIATKDWIAFPVDWGDDEYCWLPTEISSASGILVATQDECFRSDVRYPEKVSGSQATANLELAVAARNALPRLLDTIESQAAEIERQRAYIGLCRGLISDVLSDSERNWCPITRHCEDTARRLLAVQSLREPKA